jgi:adenylosuccinate synthase
VKKRGNAKIGTTGRGIGPAYEDKVAVVLYVLQTWFVVVQHLKKTWEMLEYITSN